MTNHNIQKRLDAIEKRLPKTTDSASQQILDRLGIPLHGDTVFVSPEHQDRMTDDEMQTLEQSNIRVMVLVYPNMTNIFELVATNDNALSMALSSRYLPYLPSRR